jgi:hypothetical protein
MKSIISKLIIWAANKAGYQILLIRYNEDSVTLLGDQDLLDSISKDLRKSTTAITQEQNSIYNMDSWSC